MEKHPLTIFTEKDIIELLEIGKLYQQKNPTILFVKKGEASVSLQINEIKLTANSILLLDPNSIYKIESFTKDFEARAIVYENEYIQKLGLKLNKLQVFKHFKTHINRTAHLPDTELKLLWTQIEVIAEILCDEPSSNYNIDIVEHLFSAFIYGLAGSLLTQKRLEKNTMTRQEEITFEFVKNVFENFKTEKLLQFYADRQNLTIRHLSSVVKKVTEKTANQIISEFVMNEAKILLSTSRLAIQDVANTLNFSDPYSFSHFFKKHSRISPVQYKSSSKQ